MPKPKDLTLPAHVHAVAIDADLVFLDAELDAYFCLAGAGQALALRPGGRVEVLHDKAVEPLIEAGLLAPDVAVTARSLPPPPVSDLRAHGGRPSLGRMVRALSANAKAARAVADLPFNQLLKLSDPNHAAGDLDAPAPPALIVEAARFSRLAPWLPHGGVCLMRSLQLLFYLRGLGFAPTWVFGVRTWPFAAHCWLQAGEVVLDDSVEHVRAYSPILAV